MVPKPQLFPLDSSRRAPLLQVEVGGGFRVPAYSRISLLAQPTEDEGSDEELEYDQAGVGGVDATKGELPNTNLGG